MEAVLVAGIELGRARAFGGLARAEQLLCVLAADNANGEFRICDRDGANGAHTYPATNLGAGGALPPHMVWVKGRSRNRDDPFPCEWVHQTSNDQSR